MMRQTGRYAYPATVAALLLGIGALLAFLSFAILSDYASVPSASPSPALTSPWPSTMPISAIGIAMPPDADCNACHVTASGAIGVKPVPDLGHPLTGFADCTACHNPTGLVKTAPGHSSLHKDECLICHQENPALIAGTAAPMRPEHMGATQPCTACHGVDQHAPLPASMAGRGNNCWICHNGPEFRYLFEPPVPGSPAPSGLSYPLVP